MSTCRLIDTGMGHPFYVTALDEAIADARKNNVVPDTLHFYRRNHQEFLLDTSKQLKTLTWSFAENTMW